MSNINQRYILDIIEEFKSNQTLSTIERLKNLGIGLKILKSNNWENLNCYKLPFERFVILYDDNLKICSLGVY